MSEVTDVVVVVVVVIIGQLRRAIAVQKPVQWVKLDEEIIFAREEKPNLHIIMFSGIQGEVEY